MLPGKFSRSPRTRLRQKGNNRLFFGSLGPRELAIRRSTLNSGKIYIRARFLRLPLPQKVPDPFLRLWRAYSGRL